MIKQIIVYPVYDKNRDNKIAQARHKLKNMQLIPTSKEALIDFSSRHT